MNKSKTRSDEKTLMGIKANGPVFISSLLIIAILVISTIIVGEPMEKWFVDTQIFIANHVGWFFILLVNGVLLFAISLGFGKYRNIRIGGKDAKPEFSRIGWFSMLFSAGMGIGLLFWSVAEPVFHFNSNPFLEQNGNDVAAAKSAMGITFLHWGVHAWALYAIVGVALAFFTFNKKLPLTAMNSDWKTPNDIKQSYANVSILKDCRIVFNIKGNSYRLVIKFNFEHQLAFVRFIGTHSDYDKIDVNNV